MRAFIPVALPLMLVVASARADALADAKTALATLTAHDPVTARVAFDYWHRDGDDAKPHEDRATITLEASAGPDGLHVLWPAALLAADRAEQLAHAANGERSTPTRRAMDALAAAALNDQLDAAPGLRLALDRAQLVEERPETYGGQPARRLTLKLTLPLSEQDRKYVKDLDATATLWLGADGLPLGAERRVHVKGRALLVISFETDEREEFKFGHIGDRLVMLRHVKETTGSGGGQSGRQKTTATLSVLDGAASA